MKKRISLRALRILLATLSFGICALAFYGYGGTFLAKIQAMPALLRTLTAFAVGSLVILLLLALLTFVFGRVYCSILCPFGILQDILAWIGKRLRHVFAGLAIGALVAGSATVLFELDPYSIFGRLVSSNALGTFLPVILILAVLAYFPRVFCNAICPVGAILGYIARFSPLKLTVNSTCTRCGSCVKNCPAHCIDLKASAIDNERCIRCFKCTATCPQNAISFGKKAKQDNEKPNSEGRRDFIANACLVTAGLAAGAALTKCAQCTASKPFSPDTHFLPPGAGSPQRFANRCTGCHLCIDSCPQKIIVPTQNNLVALDLQRNFCDFNCNACTQTCPTGAIRPLPLPTKQRTKIAVVQFEPTACLLFDKNHKAACAHCVSACPTKAFTALKGADGRDFPRFSPDLCVGCGACTNKCPKAGQAIRIAPVQEQTLTDSERVASNKRKVARYLARHCIVPQEGKNCGKCALACPTGAITLKRRRTGLEFPAVNSDFCVGCGLCEKACPAETKAIVLEYPKE